MSEKRGVIYMCWGQQAISQAEQSMLALWQHEKLPVAVTGDAEAAAYFEGRPLVTTILVETDPFDENGRRGHKFMAGRIKPLLAKLSPFEQTLYVDADTVFKSSPKAGFGMLELGWDLIVAETQTRSLVDTIAGPSESKWTAEWLRTEHLLYHNSGMIFWRRNERTDRAFELWGEEWLRFQNWDEQVALLRALLRSEAVFQTVPYTWNCRDRREAVLLHHWFGTGHARTEGKRQARPRAEDFAGRELVQVEVEPGRWAKCYFGDEEKVREAFKNRNRRHQHEGSIG